MKKPKTIFILGLILLTALAIRLYKIDQVPSSLWYDELDAGYQARSLIQTGKDYRGTLSPFYVNAFLDPRTPIPIYFTVLTTIFFKTPELQVRMPSVILGTLNVLLIFLLVRLIFGKPLPALIAALVAATNPWQIQFSRFSHEGESSIFFILLSLIFLLTAMKSRKIIHYLLFTINLSLCIYTYRTMTLYVPILFIIILLTYFRPIVNLGLKRLIILVTITITITAPFLYFTYFASRDIPRINQINITSDKSIPIFVQRNREVDSGDLTNPTLGKKAIFSSFIFHNKLQSWLTKFADNYLQDFSSDFLFLSGDSNHRHSIPGQGMFLYIDIIGLIFGIIFIYKNIAKREIQFFSLWLLSSPIPAALTIDGAKHGARLINFSAPLIILVGFGWYFAVCLAKSVRKSKIATSFFVSLWLLSFIFYFHRYLIHFPIVSAREFSYGYKQVVQKVTQIEGQYQKIAFSNSDDPPILFYLFWANIPPKYVQQYGTDYTEKVYKHLPLDKYKTFNLDKTENYFKNLGSTLENNTLYVINQSDTPYDLRSGKPIPTGIKILDTILYPDNSPAFYLITKS
jgi:4-amino-4-deoxy-L-arabinose transferase-like glycosyltransferase